jgi:hypothetical protein
VLTSSRHDLGFILSPERQDTRLLDVHQQGGRARPSIGHHMAESAPGISSEERHRRFCLFWSICCLERSTALRLARPSAIRDQHVTIPKPNEYPPLQGLTPSRQSLIYGVEMSKIHGHTYDDLFSPSALQSSQHLGLPTVKPLQRSGVPSSLRRSRTWHVEPSCTRWCLLTG